MEHYTHVLADITSEDDIKGLLGTIRRRYGRLDVLVNNAGVASMNHSLLTPASALDRTFATNLRGTFLVTREGAKLMRLGGFGRVVNFTTVAVPLHLEGEAAYVASKAAIEELTRVLARELAAFGITVNAIGPGPVETDLIRGVPKAAIQGLLSRLAIHRLCSAEDVFHVLRFLIDPASNYITGQVIYLGGI
jgi:3-oxoacyl-[acyl-carrier protein] reductase